MADHNGERKKGREYYQLSNKLSIGTKEILKLIRSD